MEKSDKTEIGQLSQDLSFELEQTLKACAVTNLRKTTRAITQLYNEALQAVELLSTQFILLASVTRYGPITINELSDLLVMDRTTLARELKPLQKRGLLSIRAGDNDLRTRLIRVTPQGLQLLMEAVPLHQNVQVRIEVALGQQQFGMLLALLSETLGVVRDK